MHCWTWSNVEVNFETTVIIFWLETLYINNSRWKLSVAQECLLSSAYLAVNTS